MLTAVPALSLAPPMPASPEAVAAGDAFALLVARLAGTVVMAENPTLPGGALPVAGAATAPAADEADWPVTADAPALPPAVPPLVPVPAMTASPSEPPTTVAEPARHTPPVALPSTPSPSAVLPAAPAAGERREPAGSPTLGTHHGDVGAEPVAALALDVAPRATVAEGEPGPRALPAPPEALLSPGEATSRALALRDVAAAATPLPADLAGAAPVDGSGEAMPAPAAAQTVRPTPPARPSPAGTGRTVRDPDAAIATRGSAESTAPALVLDRPPAVRTDLPTAATTPTPPADGRTDGVRGMVPGGELAPPAIDCPDAGPARLYPQLTVAIVRQAADGLDRVKVQLQPEELGAIEIALELGEDGRARAAFLADRPETVDLLRREAADLERALRQVGVEVGTGGMSFASRDPNGGRDREPGAPPPPPSHPERATIGQAPSPIPARGGASRLLDLTV